jgi:hypothetical protein
VAAKTKEKGEERERFWKGKKFMVEETLFFSFTFSFQLVIN